MQVRILSPLFNALALGAEHDRRTHERPPLLPRCQPVFDQTRAGNPTMIVAPDQVSGMPKLQDAMNAETHGTENSEIRVRWDTVERIFATVAGGCLLAAITAILLLFVRFAVAENTISQHDKIISEGVYTYEDRRVDVAAQSEREASLIGLVAELAKQNTEVAKQNTETARLLASLTSRVEALAANQDRIRNTIESRP